MNDTHANGSTNQKTQTVTNPAAPGHDSRTYPMVASWVLAKTPMACPTRREDVNCRMLDDEAVLFDPIDGNTFRLNPTARMIWEGCQPGVTWQDLTHQLCRQYEITPERACDDVQQMIAMFANHGLLNP